MTSFNLAHLYIPLNQKDLFEFSETYKINMRDYCKAEDLTMRRTRSLIPREDRMPTETAIPAQILVHSGYLLQLF